MLQGTGDPTKVVQNGTQLVGDIGRFFDERNMRDSDNNDDGHYENNNVDDMNEFLGAGPNGITSVEHTEAEVLSREC